MNRVRGRERTKKKKGRNEETTGARESQSVIRSIVDVIASQARPSRAKPSQTKPSQADPTQPDTSQRRADPTEPNPTLGSFTPAAHSRHYLFQMSSTASFRLRCGTSTFSSPEHTDSAHVRSPLREARGIYAPFYPRGFSQPLAAPRKLVQANRETGQRLAPFPPPHSLCAQPRTPPPVSRPLLVFKVMCSPRITTHSGARLRRFTNP